MPPPSPIENKSPTGTPGPILLAAALAAGAALRVWLALHDDGLYWPDEIYQSLEPAHRLVFGYGLVAWEFIDGARSWALPGLIAGLLGLCRLAGLSAPEGYLPAVRLLFCGLGVGTVYGAYRLARVHGASSLSAASGAAAFALAAPAIYFAPRAMSETVSALPVVLGFALALRPEPKRWERWLGASLLGAATLLRLQNGVFCVGLLGLLAARRRPRQAVEALVVLLLWAGLYGLLDRLTWGGWFHSAIQYLRFNMVEGKAAQWGVAGPGYYLRVLWTSMPLLAAVLAAAFILSLRRAPGLGLVVAMFLLLHSLTPHKELRFVLPAIPLLCALAGVGLDTLRSPFPRRALLGLLWLGGVASAASFHQLTFGQLGQYEDSRPGASAYDDSGPVNRLLLAAHRRDDLCGLKVEAVHLAWTGGSTYLHRPVPLYPHSGPPRESRLFNYAITFPAWTAGGEVVAADGNLVLLRLPWSRCLPDAGYQWRLP